jgi:hypothetical protein
MDERSRLERMPGSFRSHVARGDSVQLVIKDGDQLVQGGRIALLQPFEHLRRRRGHGIQHTSNSRVVWLIISAVDPRIRELFRELADLPREQREKILVERRIAPELRSELESLLAYDGSSSGLLTAPVCTTAEAMLRDGDPREPSYCGPYRIIRQIGSGGMGVVFLAERCDGELQQKVAIKLLRAGEKTE